MIKYWLQGLSFFFGFSFGAYLTGQIFDDYFYTYVGAIVGALLFFILTTIFYRPIAGNIERLIERFLKLPVWDTLCGTLGLILGLIVAGLVHKPLTELQKITEIPDIRLLPLIVWLALGYLGWKIGYNKRSELMATFTGGKADGDHLESIGPAI